MNCDNLNTTDIGNETEDKWLAAFLQDKKRLSYWLSYALRYGIYTSGLPVDHQGWAPVDMVAAWARSEGQSICLHNTVTAADIFAVVTTDTRGRFGLEWRPKEATWYVRATPSAKPNYSFLSGGHASVWTPEWTWGSPPHHANWESPSHVQKHAGPPNYWTVNREDVPPSSWWSKEDTLPSSSWLESVNPANPAHDWNYTTSITTDWRDFSQSEDAEDWRATGNFITSSPS